MTEGKIVETTTIERLVYLPGEESVQQWQQLVLGLQQKMAELQKQLEMAHGQIAHLEAENERLRFELNELKQAPFKAKRRKKQQEKATEAEESKPRGRQKGHEGSSRPKPKQIDKTVRVGAGEICPECGTPFVGKVVERERVVEDIEPVRPTINTCYIIERRWCRECQAYHEAPVSAALPRRRFGLNLMLFVVYQKMAIGLSYGKIKRELATYFGLTVSRGELSNIVREVSRLFGPAYKRLIRLMRQQTVLHIDETGWHVDGDNHWLWVFVNDVVTLYVLSRSRGSKVPAALLGGNCIEK